jgi:hypothetical protein
MSTGPEDDFQQFLDMGSMTNIGDSMQFDFASFPDAATQHMMAQTQEPADTMMAQSDNTNMMQTQIAPPMSSATGIATIPAHMNNMGRGQAQHDITSIDAQIQYLQQQQQQHRNSFYNHNHSVPPTPQSIEMPPNGGQYYSQAEQMPHQAIFDANYRPQAKDQQDITFTPFMSPANTPLDPHFTIDGAFSVPGAYFSPLTSPALHAQHDPGYDYSTHSNNSPVEMDLEPPANQNGINTNNAPLNTGSNTSDLAKKARKQNAAKARPKAIKNSPISKPLRRKTGPSPAIVSQVLSEVEERDALQRDQAMLPMPAACDTLDENASVSPENLTDMPPPPVPNRRSMSKSPYISAQNGNGVQPIMSAITAAADSAQQEQAQANGSTPAKPHPATPASLMKLPASKSKRAAASQQDHANNDNIESLELPESVSQRPIAPIVPVAKRHEPNAGKAPTFQAMPSPLSRPSDMTSAMQSPQIRPGSSASAARKTPLLAARNSRKRSTGSVHVSPALLPRISPNIKPLLPGTPGMSAEDTASRLLMSKSNYQNILEGNTVPGVSYPSELSTNLTSKRTSHKIAEQGRRNRINSALQEMAALLPDAAKVDITDDADKKDAKGNTPNSKASVVENAIVHMKNLEKENTELKQAMEELKQQLEKLKGEDG